MKPRTWILRVFLGIAGAAVAVVLLFSMAFVLLFGPPPYPRCDGDSPKARAARAFSDAEFRRIFEDVGRLRPEKLREYHVEAPPEFDYLDISGIPSSSTPDRVLLRLEGCFDTYLYLVVLGANGNSSREARIDLAYGEGPDSGFETLWRLSSE